MLFNSLSFIIFFIIVLFLYYIIPFKFRWVMLLIASYIFYMAWNPKLIVLIIFSSFLNYFSAGLINTVDKASIRKAILIIAVIFNFAFLFVFKYLNFISESITTLVNFLGFNFTAREFD